MEGPDGSVAIGISLYTALLYSLHAAFVVYPKFVGVLRYLRTRCGGNPLLNKGCNSAPAHPR